MATEEACIRSASALEELKKQWHIDPVWDIETTEGFEAHRHELYLYRIEVELADAKKELQALHKLISLARAFLAGNYSGLL